MPARLWTIGHSSQPVERFVTLLERHGIEALADVRRFPGSRRWPQFGGGALAQRLAEQGIEYSWFGELGGRRRPSPDSHNDAWRNAAFRGYADHLASEEFATGLARLLTLVERKHTALMCAEVLWWRCHRALIADVLQLRGLQVLHILDGKPPIAHPYTAPARLYEGRLSYREGQGRLLNDAARRRAAQGELPR